MPAYVPALHTSFPPPRPPLPSALPSPVPGQWPPIPSGGWGDDVRANPRLRTPTMPSVVLRQGSAAPVHATLRDISISGAGIARRGLLDAPPGSALRLEFHEPGSERRHVFTATVRWSRFGGVNTYLGVHFDTALSPDHPLLLALAEESAAASV